MCNKNWKNSALPSIINKLLTFTEDFCGREHSKYFSRKSYPVTLLPYSGVCNSIAFCLFLFFVGLIELVSCPAAAVSGRAEADGHPRGACPLHQGHHRGDGQGRCCWQLGQAGRRHRRCQHRPQGHRRYARHMQGNIYALTIQYLCIYSLLRQCRTKGKYCKWF